MEIENPRKKLKLNDKILDEYEVHVKHLPVELGDVTLKEFFEEYGGKVTKMNVNRTRGDAFVCFSSLEGATKTIKELNGFKLINKILSVEFTKEPKRKFWEKVLQLSEELTGIKPPDSIAVDLGVQYAPNPCLEYLYPPPNEHILNNIYNAIASVPKLYTQVLHLMNKMNLPPPFTSSTLPIKFSLQRKPGTPVIPVDIPSSIKEAYLSKRFQQETQSLIEEEEEEESEEETQTITSQPTRSATQITHSSDLPKKPSINMNISASKTQTKISEETLMIETKEMSTLEKAEEESSKLPLPTRNVISLEQIMSNKLSYQELLELPLFKDKPYQVGTPTNRLFLRNLHKNVKKSDLEFIFGRYFETDDAAKALEINIMGGKYKGNAFVVLPTIEQAKKALDEITGYILHEKPIVIEFGRKRSEEK